MLNFWDSLMKLYLVLCHTHFSENFFLIFLQSRYYAEWALYWTKKLAIKFSYESQVSIATGLKPSS